MNPTASVCSEIELSSDEAYHRYEEAVVGIFADLAELFGNPRSYGAIYGILFANESPLSLESISKRIAISQGSTSQGLRVLETFGAVVRDKPADARFALFSAKLEMKVLIAGFLKERAIPRLASTEERVKELQNSLPDHPDCSRAKFRLERLAKWHRSARTFLPLIHKVLGAGTT